MKRLKSNDDIESYGEKSVVKDWGRRDEDSGLHRSSSSLHRNSHYKSFESGRNVPSSSSSRYERIEDERESSRLVRKRTDYNVDTSDRRKSYDRQRDAKERGILSSSPMATYGTDKMYRSESFSGPRRDFPKGFRSERDRSRRDGSVTSWRRYGTNKDGDDVARSGSELSRGNRTGSEEVGKPKSPHVFRGAKSPAWSKDSGSEHSKSIEVKKYDDKSVESGGGPSAEREEGELELEPQPRLPSPEPVVKDKEVSEKELNSRVNENALQEKEGPQSDKNEKASKMVQDVVNKNEKLPDSNDTQENVTVEETERGSDVKEQRKEAGFEADDAGGSFDDNLSSLQEKKEEKGIDFKMKEDRCDTTGNAGMIDRGETPLAEEMVQTWKDKGKSVAMSPTNSVHFTESNLDVDYKQRDVPTSGDMDIEGPSTRGFQFFSSDPIKKQERVEESPHTKPKDDKLTLDLSLSLPNVLLPIGSHNMPQAPGSPSHAGSIQSFPSSFQTNSESFMPSMSYSGSQQFTHNLSCSLTNNGYDFEKSVKSKPLFKGVDWNALSENENKNKDIPSHQGTSSRGNGFYQPTQVPQGNSSAQANRVTGGSSKELVGFERQLRFNKKLYGKQHIISSENGSRQKDNGGLRSFDPTGKEEVLAFGTDFAESIVTMIVSEPLHTVTRRFNDINEQHVASVKNFVLDIITNPGKQWQLSALQTTLRKRSDTLDSLVNANHTQLEILVALKTGLKEFLLQKNDIHSSDLAEIFLNTRCRNLACKSLLPIDECDCKICTQRNGFCRECMCLVCSKFDNASKTCSWVGCDVCLHWCHADCALKESFIRNGRNTEMQFHCVACGHPSEMFGFVKEVFLNFLKEWTAENLYRELEYVRKIFSASEDGRGKQLHEIAIRMLSKLGDRADYKDVQNYIMRFFTETDSLKHGNFSTEPRNELPTKNQERSVGFATSSQGAVWMKPAYPDKSPLSENPNNSLPLIRELPTKDHERSNSIVGSSHVPDWLKSADLEKSTPLENVISGFDSGKYMDFRSNAKKQPVFDELESIVRVKHAEAKMFQTRADDARREAEALKTIAVAKNGRIEEEYSSRIAKLRLAEAEEMRRQKLEELKDLERVYHEYFSMKMRMETDIKDLLLKMEATRRNLTT